MFNIGMGEFIVIGALALIFIGPKQLPEVARMVGRMINELKRAGEEVFGSFNDVRNDARRFVDRTNKDLEDIYKPPEPILHKGAYPTEQPDIPPVTESAAPAAPVVNVTVADTKLEPQPEEPSAPVKDDKRES